MAKRRVRRHPVVAGLAAPLDHGVTVGARAGFDRTPDTADPLLQTPATRAWQRFRRLQVSHDFSLPELIQVKRCFSSDMVPEALINRICKVEWSTYSCTP